MEFENSVKATDRGELPAMRILIYSHTFAPHVGGVETYAMSLAQGLVGQRQHDPDKKAQVTVVTPTPAGNMDDAILPFQVTRQPRFATLLGLLKEADIIHIAGPSLLPMLVGLLFRKPVVVEHHGYQAICPNGLLLYNPQKVSARITLCGGVTTSAFDAIGIVVVG